MILLLLFLLPNTALAAISVDITAASSSEQAAVTAIGEQTDTVSDKEIKSFRIDGNHLKDAIKKANGGYPTDAYLRKPGGPHKLYDKYGWHEVERVLSPKNARLLNLKTQPTIVAKKRFTNRGNRNATYSAEVQESLENTVSSTWTQSQEVTVTTEVHVSVNFVVGEAGGSISLGYGVTWGEEETKSQTVLVGSSTGVTVTLEAGEIVEAQLSCNRGTQQIEVEYESYLYGDVAINYEKPYKKHHFHVLDIDVLLYKANLSNEITTKQTLQVGFYSDADVVITDIKSKEPKVTQPVEIKKKD